MARTRSHPNGISEIGALRDASPRQERVAVGIIFVAVTNASRITENTLKLVRRENRIRFTSLACHGKI